MNWSITEADEHKIIIMLLLVPYFTAALNYYFVRESKLRIH
jgi:hypothetical protein